MGLGVLRQGVAKEEVRGMPGLKGGPGSVRSKSNHLPFTITVTVHTASQAACM